MTPRSRSSSKLNDDSEYDEESAILTITRHLIKPNGSIIGREVAETIRPQFRNFVDAIPPSSRPALASIDGRHAVSHSRLVDFITNEFGPAIHRLGFGRGHRVALVLPNGPELAAAIVAVGYWASCVPLAATGASQELEADLQRCKADVVIGPYSRGPLPPPVMDNTGQFPALQTNTQDWTVFKSIEASATALGIPFIGLVPSPVEVGIFQLVVPGQEFATKPTLRDGPVDSSCNTPQDEILVLFTSGTTGNKKLVPHLLGDMLTAATVIALSWNLTSVDVNCNLMPLFHVGGIVRQVFSPLISGGCVICCPSFDPSIFWTLLEQQAFNWYYAAPTMHQVILQQYPAENFATIPPPRLRMIANAAGGLLPSLAVQLRERFGAYVLPSYGMTECMPISSPPSNYELTKPGTSGVPVGPEVAIMNLSTVQPIACNEEGPICVRGEPSMRGYGTVGGVNGTPDTDAPETFLPDGWFNTGDLGYLDEDGYLYVTGRSKEVINRGGEIISPMEVEEAISSHPDIDSCAAFSAAHNVLQEVVGICVVMRPGRPRLDLPSLHEYLGTRLAAPKWPQCLVFMDDLPKSHTNKLLRVKLGNRLTLPELTDNMTPLERTVEAKCPAKGADLTVPIPAQRVTASITDVQKLLSEKLGVGSNRHVHIRVNEKRPGTFIGYVFNVDRMEAVKVAREFLDRYAVPTHFVEMPSTTTFPLPKTTDAVSSILQSAVSTGPVDSQMVKLQEIFADLLKLDYLPGPDANFFHLGGSSMMASQLASKIRKQFDVPCNGAEIFHHTSCNELSMMIRKRTCDDTTASSSDLNGSSDDSSIGSARSVSDHGAPFIPDRLSLKCSWGAALFQLVPMFIVFPIWQVTRYLLFFAVLLNSFNVVPVARDIGTFVLSYLVFHILWITITPLLFVAIKWLVIGRYKAGRYPIWSGYYLRWWFVDVCRKLFLRGIWGSHEFLHNFYLRLLGVTVGTGTRISLECEIAEFDLVNIGDNVSLELCTFRAFGVDNGAMILGPVSVGNNGSVGIKSVVAPYTSVPDDGHLGPVTSTYDMKAIDPKNVYFNRKSLAEPNFWMKTFVGGPIEFFVNCVGQIPPLLILLMMLQVKGEEIGSFSTPSDLMAWLCNPHRVPYFLGIRIARAVITPFFYMVTAIAVKWLVIGEFKEGPRDTNSQWQLLRHQLAGTLFSRKKIQAVTDIIGRHYELVSILYRLLGAKVGQRVFWPGHQPIFTGEFDLLEIGDDVVFGSRSAILCTTQDSCEKVILCAGANVADNCVVLPGSIIGKNAVLGSNSLCPKGWYLPESSVWLGSKGGEPDCLDGGVVATDLPSKSERKVQMTGDSTTLRPFGKAFYLGKAKYYVLPLRFIVAFCMSIKVFISTFHALPLLGGFYGASAVLYGVTAPHPAFVENQYTFAQVYFALLFVYFFMNIIRVVLWLVIELVAKWTLIGRRQPGTYNYDTCDYAQRWELYQLISKIRKFSRYNFLQFFFGTPYMTAYFRWNGGNIGRDCCLYPSGADPFMPEPDLVNMGDRCVVDCASIVAHLNTRGNFDLATITLEEECTLRTRSRVQQGVYMEAGSQLLEKSLALTGEVIEADSVWQGGPASLWFQYTKTKSTTATAAPYATTDSFESTDETTKLLSGKTLSYSQV